MVTLIRSDLEFILQQILAAESGTQPTDPNLPFGLRTVDGSNNNLIEGQSNFGAADQVFPRMTDPFFRTAEAGTSFAQTTGDVTDSRPRTISNLIVDQTATNPSAVAVAGGVAPDPDGTLFIPNVTPDGGASASFNSWFTLFGQFFDHGLDLVNKGTNGTIFIPLKPDDPLYVEGSPTNFMVLTRATDLPGPDGVVGTGDDIHEQVNQTTPLVDQNQTYTSHPSHQVFLREYAMDASGKPQATGRLLENRDPGSDGKYFTDDDVVLGGLATWAVVKANAATFLGIGLTDEDATDLPLLATDPYGQFLRGADGFAQVVMSSNTLVEGNASAPISTGDAVRTGHAFLNDIANSAVPRSTDGTMLAPDADNVAGVDDGAMTTYDDELLNAHYTTGDGRGNENIGLTAVHVVFHGEHNGLVDQIKSVVLSTNDPAFLSQWLVDGTVPATFPTSPDEVNALQWNGERLFQAARFGTEMQYQHLVFEEFARRIQPDIDEFEATTTDINPAIVAEFAHTVYRFGHSMLTDTVARTNPDGTPNDIGLIEAFINPLAFAASGPTQAEAAGAIVRGMTNQVGNEIDEFVTDALRNNLLGLPLDLATINITRGRDTGIPSLNAARREFFQDTGDAALEPYDNWADFGQGIKHPESLINFIAAYGAHPTIAAATTLEEKRAAATSIVLGGDEEPADRLDFLNSTGSWASDANGVTSTGLDEVDLWIGGLAEKQMSDGGLLGSTFAFVFETQLEKLQDGDRFYYLSRTAGLNFLTELEDSSFAEMIMRNTDATHLPFDVFSTPDFTIEAGDQTTWPAGLVTTAHRAIQFTGDQHVVLGGTAGKDNLRAGGGNDTIWGDEGNDVLAGGAGNDAVMGGAGNDIISDRTGDDVLRGGDGKDTISSGPGEDLLLGGAGADFIKGGADAAAKEAFGGLGNDIIRIGGGPDEVFGNEGDDWINGEAGDDELIGDNDHPQALSTIIGHDVLIGGSGTNHMDGENGDDILVSGQGVNQNLGRQGFDWVSFAASKAGVIADLALSPDAADAAPAASEAARTATEPASPVETSDTYMEVEALSGSRSDDVLKGDDAAGNAPPTAGLIKGLEALLGPTPFGGGNIILGGKGSDTIEGRGGNDFIDGDASLTVHLTKEAAGGAIVREISSTTKGARSDIDTAVFSDVRDNYTVTLDDGGTARKSDDVVTVSHLNGAGADGIDTLRHIEQLQFSDTAIPAEDSSIAAAIASAGSTSTASPPAPIPDITAGDDTITLPPSLGSGGVQTAMALPADGLDPASAVDADTTLDASLPISDDLTGVGPEVIPLSGGIAGTTTTTPDDFRFVA